MTPLSTFLAAHMGRAREPFLKDVTEPHLLLRQRLHTGASDEDLGTTRVMDAGSASPGNPMLLPVRKTTGANEFTNMVTLGRAPGNDIVLQDARVSRLQAFFRRDRGWWSIGDVCSTNGTTVDGKRVTKEQVLMINSGSKIVLAGALELEFLDPEGLFRLLLDESLKALLNRHAVAAQSA
jgi:hypothetical protein